MVALSTQRQRIGMFKHLILCFAMLTISQLCSAQYFADVKYSTNKGKRG